MAKIVGNIVGLPSPRSDWNQTDEMKADFIKNKPVEALNLQHYGDSNIVPTDNSFFSFETNDETMEATITGYIGAETSVVIPYEYKVNGKTYKITKSAELAFLQSSISEAIFPEGFKEFGGGDFVQSSLRKIVIPKSVSMLGSDMFFDSQLSIVYYMGTEEQWKSLESKSYAPLYMGKVVCLGEGNVIPVSQKYVESLLASGNGSPEEKINSLQYYGNADIVPSDESIFDVYQISEGKGGIQTIDYPGNIRGEIVIPYEIRTLKITEIPNSSFWELGATKVTIPSCVEEIDEAAFYGSSIEEIVFCGVPKEIKKGAFSNCSALKTVYFNGTQEQWNAIVNPEGNGYLLGATVYFDCTDVTMEKVEKKIAENVGDVAEIAKLVNEFKPILYYGDSNTKQSDKFTVVDIINEKEGTVSICTVDFPGDLSGEIVVPYEVKDTYGTFGDTNKTYKVGAFCPQSGLMFFGGDRVVIPNCITAISEACFWQSNVKEIVICGTVMAIGSDAFLDCSNLTDIYYKGSQYDWNTKVTGKENIPSGVTIHYLWT